MAAPDPGLTTLFTRLRSAAEDVGNAIDAGLGEASTAALERLQTGINEVERVAKTNGSPTNGVVANAKPEAQNLEAEQAVLGAIMLSPGVLPNVSVIVTAEDFYSEQHRLIFQAAQDLAAISGGIDSITVAGQLEQAGTLERAGGKARVVELAALALSAPNAPQYARLVRECSLKRRLGRAVIAGDAEAIAEAAMQLTREHIAGDPRRALDGADWLAAQPDGCPAVWGRGDTVLWAQGEPLMLYGPDGVGKTSVAQQVVLGLCGIRHEPLFDLPLQRADRPVLYLACDRPRQARRSLFRMIPRENHSALSGRLLVWEGPLPFSIPANPKALLDFCLLHGAGTVIVDSLKDVAVDLVKPDIALRVNQAFQWLNANGIELLVLHHPRKDPAGSPSKPKELEDVYGDRNFVAGMGSVVLLWGKAGDPIVELHHLKQPAAEFGPMKIVHDHEIGVSALHDYKELIEILSDAGGPLSIGQLAMQFFGVTDPSSAQTMKVRRQLNKMLARHEIDQLQSEDLGVRFAAR